MSDDELWQDDADAPDAPDEPRSRVKKAPTAFRTISEVADELHIPQHVLRFWEQRFPQVKPLKRGGGRRYYRPEDVDLLRRISTLLYVQGYTIKGVQRLLREGGSLDAVPDAPDERLDEPDELPFDPPVMPPAPPLPPRPFVVAGPAAPSPRTVVASGVAPGVAPVAEPVVARGVAPVAAPVVSRALAPAPRSPDPAARAALSALLDELLALQAALAAKL